MQIASMNVSTQSTIRPQLDSTSAARPASRPQEETARSSKEGVLLVSDEAQEAAEQLTYDQPSGREGKALMAYQSVATQSRRDELQQMLRVDLYA
jgi:hypothetical protein